MLLSYALALPDDPHLDSFQSGVDEVDAYFRTRRWFNAKKGKASPPTYQFRTRADGDVVGYAAVAFQRRPHARDDAEDKAKYLVVYAVGVDQGYQGKANPNAPGETYAVSLFKVIEGFAINKDDCVGLSLWVRANNSRAIVFYEKVGFVADPGGPVQRADGAPHLTMRKLLQRQPS